MQSVNQTRLTEEEIELYYIAKTIEMFSYYYQMHEASNAMYQLTSNYLGDLLRLGIIPPLGMVVYRNRFDNSDLVAAVRTLFNDTPEKDYSPNARRQ